MYFHGASLQSALCSISLRLTLTLYFLLKSRIVTCDLLKVHESAPKYDLPSLRGVGYARFFPIARVYARKLMSSVFFICFRECIETSIVVSVLLAFLKQTLGDQHDSVYKKLMRQVCHNLQLTR